MTNADIWMIALNSGLFIATAVASFFAAAQAISAKKDKQSAEIARDAAVEAQLGASAALKATATTLAESANATGIRMRAPYGAALERHAIAIVTARVQGKTGLDLFRVTAETGADYHRLQIESGHPSAIKISHWIMTYCRFADDPTAGDTFFSILNPVTERVRAWVFSPDEAMRTIREDPLLDYPNDAGVELPSADYRIP